MSAGDLLKLDLTLERSGFNLNVNLSLPSGGVSVLFGPSGSGKTTLLRCIAGLEHAKGRVSFNDEVWQDSRTGVFVPTWRRAVGYVFQEASLFEHLSVEHNLMFGLKRTRPRPADHELKDALNRLGIDHLLRRSVGGLSGGERQRVAIARALLTRPKVLLLDEPLASLDPNRRQEVLPWLERLHLETQKPIVYVTHSVDELARLADHLVLLNQGSVQTSGPITEVMATPEVALAIGEEAGVVTTGQIAERSVQDAMIRIEFGAGTVWSRDSGLSLGQQVRIRILARDVSLARTPMADSTIQNRLQGQVESIRDDVHPAQALVSVRCASELILGRVTHRSLKQLGIQVGDPVWCQVKSVAIMT